MKAKRNFAFILPFLTFVFIFCGLIIRNLKLSYLPFYDWDEGIYAQIAREIIKNKSLITTFNGQLWLDKPPLANVLIAVMFSLFGTSEFNARILISFLSIILLFLTYFLTKKTINSLFKNKVEKMNDWQKQITYLLPVFFLCSSGLYIERSTILNTDIMLGIGWVGYLLFIDNFYLKLLFLNIGVLSKSLLGFYPVLIELFTVTKKSFSKKNIWKTLILITTSSLWYVYGYFKFGNDFFVIHFYKQMIKRVVVPIELHFGDKFYYLQFILRDIGPLAIFLIFAYILLFYEVLKDFLKKGPKIVKAKQWWDYLILFSPIPFFLFLNVGKSKLFWYLTMLLPLFALSYSYLYMKIKNRFLKWFFVIFMLIFFIYKFTISTYLLIQNSTPPDRILLAKCLSKKPETTIAFLVNEDERKIRNFLEAAHFDTNSSFLYGGSPSFVYYIEKRVDYYYNVDDFLSHQKKYDLIALSNSDYKTNEQLRKTFTGIRKEICSTNDWKAFIKYGVE